MYLYKLSITNFRGIKNLVWKPNRYRNVLLGENGGGKSTIALALDYLLNPYLQWYKKTMAITEYYNRDSNNEIIIEAWFKDLDDFIVGDNELYLQHVCGDKIDEEGDEVALILRFMADKGLNASHHIVSNGSIRKLTQTQKGLVGFTLLEAERNSENELSFYAKSLLNRRIQESSVKESIKKIIEDFDNNASGILMDNQFFSGVLNAMSKDYHEFNIVGNPESSISVESYELTDKKTLQAFSLVFSKEGLDAKIPLKYHSKGTKNAMLLIALFEELKNKGLVFIEEPEQNLEPQMQKRIINRYSSISDGQLFISSHSTDIVKQFSYDEIFIVSEGNIIGIPNPSDIHSVIGKRFEKFEKSELIEGLFSKIIVVVEGPSEYGAFRIFSNEMKFGLEFLGAKLICADGVTKVKYFAEMFEKSGKKVVCLIDNDSGIENEIAEIHKVAPNTIVILQSKDYEESLLESNVFLNEWMNIVDEIQPFSTYKSNYFKPFNKASNRPILQERSDEFEDVTTYPSLQSIVDNLGDNLNDYIADFIHKNMQGIIDAKNIAIRIVELANENSTLPYPESFRQFMTLINIIAGNQFACDNASLCFVNVRETPCMECIQKHDNAKIIELKGVR